MWCHAVILQLGRIRDQPFIQTSGQEAAVYSADLHFLLIACGNLLKALRRIKAMERRIPRQTRINLVRLRDYYEHWEEARSARGKAWFFFAHHHPEVDPLSAVWHAHGISIAGLVDLNTLWKQVEDILVMVEAQ